MASQIISRLPVLLVEGMESLILSHYSLTKQFLNTIDPDLLEEISKRKALNIFTIAASETPAYAKFLRRNLVVYEVPIAYYGRSYEQGKKIRWSDSAQVLRAIARYGVDGSHAAESSSGANRGRCGIVTCSAGTFAVA